MKKYFFTGFALFLPTALTFAVFLFLFDFFTTPFVPIVSGLLRTLEAHWGFTIPYGVDIAATRLFALLLLVAFIVLLGVIARWFLIRQILQGTEALFSRIPVLKTIFNLSRDIFSALFGQGDKKVFKRPVMIPFPGKPNQSIGFLAGDVPEECSRKAGEPLAAVFTPTAPHPISGFLLLIPQKDLTEISFTNEDAVKYLVSCGLIVPEES